jgi:hypothetical protein
MMTTTTFSKALRYTKLSVVGKDDLEHNADNSPNAKDASFIFMVKVPKISQHLVCLVKLPFVHSAERVKNV